jgi:hypothetical protein
MTGELRVPQNPSIDSNLAAMLIGAQAHACGARIQVCSLCAACSQMRQRILGVEPRAAAASDVGRMYRWLLHLRCTQAVSAGADLALHLALHHHSMPLAAPVAVRPQPCVQFM